MIDEAGVVAVAKRLKKMAGVLCGSPEEMLPYARECIEVYLAESARTPAGDVVELAFKAATNRLYEMIPPGMLGKGDMAIALHLRECVIAALATMQPVPHGDLVEMLHQALALRYGEIEDRSTAEYLAGIIGKLQPVQVDIPEEATNEMIIAALEASLKFRTDRGLDDVQPDSPGGIPAEMVRVVWRAMRSAARAPMPDAKEGE